MLCEWLGWCLYSLKLALGASEIISESIAVFVQDFSLEGGLGRGEI